MPYSASHKIVIGRNETVNLPLLGIQAVEAKMDTGAFHASLHCDRIEWISRGRRRILRVSFPDNPEPVDITPRRKVKVRSSFGETEERHLIRTTIEMGGQSFPVDFTLADRRSLRYRVLLGREALKGRYLVDVGRKNLAGKRKGKT